MMFFVDYVQTYRNVNNKGQEMGNFLKSFEKLIIPNESALSFLQDSIEAKVEELNAKYPRTKEIEVLTFESDNDCMFYVRVKGDAYNHVCQIHIKEVKGTYSSNKEE